LTQIIKLLLTMIPQQRGRTLREQPASYLVVPELQISEVDLSEKIPLP
jgi:hypothetical protein